MTEIPWTCWLPSDQQTTTVNHIPRTDTNLYMTIFTFTFFPSINLHWLIWVILTNNKEDLITKSGAYAYYLLSVFLEDHDSLTRLVTSIASWPNILMLIHISFMLIFVNSKMNAIYQFNTFIKGYKYSLNTIYSIVHYSCQHDSAVPKALLLNAHYS